MFDLTLMEIVGISIVGTLFVVQLFYYLFFYSALLSDKDEKPKDGKVYPVSVVICARNEYRNLKKNLPIILEQDYSEFQVVVINDCSGDESEDYLMELQKKYPHLYYSSIKEDPVFKHGKKLAVTMGIKAAKYDHLLFTDADCTPVSDQWIKSMASNFTETKTMVLGTYRLKREKGMLNHMQQYENLHSKILYLGYALRKRPYMGVGGNLAYERKMFFENKGFAGHYHIPSGDDDLFVNSVANATNTAIEYSVESQVETEGKTEWYKYFTQKRRHMGASTHYKRNHKRLLFFDTLTMGLFFVFSVVSLILNILPLLVASLIFVRILVAGIIINKCAKKLGHERFYISYLWYDLLLPAIYLVLVTKNKLQPKSVRWK